MDEGEIERDLDVGEGQAMILLRIRKRKQSIFLLPAFLIPPDITPSEWRSASDANCIR